MNATLVQIGLWILSTISTMLYISYRVGKAERDGELRGETIDRLERTVEGLVRDVGTCQGQLSRINGRGGH
jgi:hypothetical protein